MAAPDPLVKVSVDMPLPGAGKLAGLKLAVMPLGNPETRKVSDELKPPKAVAVNFTVPFVELVMVRLPTLPVNASPGTFIVSDCFCVMPPPLADTTIAQLFGVTLEAAENVTVVAPAPGADTTLAGRNCAVTPSGRPVTVSVMAALNVEFGVVVRVTVCEPPATTLMEVAEAPRVNVGAGATVTERVRVCFTVPPLAATVAE